MSMPVLRCAQLRAAGRDLPPTFALELPDGERLAFLDVLRLLPGRRISGRVRWRGGEAFAKLFVGEAARRYGERELAGIRALQGGGVPTPALLAAMALADGGFLVVSAFLPGATTLAAMSDEPARIADAVALVGRLHAAGLVHEDLHFGNFLCHDGQLLLIDGDGIRPAAEGRQRQANLALLLSQLPVALDGRRDAWLPAYGQAVDAAALARQVDDWRQRRLRRFLAKSSRDCTQFAVDRDAGRFVVAVREMRAAVADLLRAPDAAMRAGQLLKDGGTCTVARVAGAHGALAIKRYNLKHWRHALSRAWRPSRAWHSWQAALRLAFFGIATPAPLAMIEERWGPLRRRAFLITEFCPGRSLQDVLSADSGPEAPPVQALVELFRCLHGLGITHGDLKASNLLWDDGRIVLIDLDALTQHRSRAAFVRAWRRDRGRLLRNWPADSRLHRWLAQALPGDDLSRPAAAPAR